MAAQRYKIYLLSVEKYFMSEHSSNSFQHSKINFVSPSDHVIFFLLYKM